LIVTRPSSNINNTYTITVGGGGGGGSGISLASSSVGSGSGGGYILGPGGTFTGWVASGTTRHYHKPSSWEPWFAWRPVKIEKQWRWLTKVYRKKLYYGLENITESIKFDWIYGTIFDVLMEEQDGIN
jgi:hypothetical protein